MYFDVTSEQDALRDVAREYLAERAPITTARELMQTSAGFDPDLWKGMAELGWQAMAIPEQYGGAGFSFLELGILMEEMGRMLLPAPFLSSVVLGANAILLGGTEEQRHEYLPSIASGERRVALAVAETEAGWSLRDVQTSVREDSGVYVLDGVKSFVIDGHTSDLLVVAARDEAGGIDLYLVDAGTSGVTAERLETMDMTRKQAGVMFDGAPAIDMLGAPGLGAHTIERLYDVVAVMLAYEQVGGAQRCLELSVAYAGGRMQFGRAIGSFQAIKHRCADMLVSVEAARSTAFYGGWALANDDGDLPVAAALAKVRCSDAFFDVTAEMIQVHGGIGFTWEHDAHLYFKRARTDQLLFGGPEEWRAKLGDRVGL